LVTNQKYPSPNRDDFESVREAEEEAIRRRAGMESKLCWQVNTLQGVAGKNSGLTFQLPRQLLYHGFGDGPEHRSIFVVDIASMN
jgi:hypothetical protein